MFSAGIENFYRTYDPHTTRCKGWVLSSLKDFEDIAQLDAYLYANGLLHRTSEYALVQTSQNEQYIFIKVDKLSGVQASFWKPYDRVLLLKGIWLEKDARSKFANICQRRGWPYRKGLAGLQDLSGEAMEDEESHLVEEDPLDQRPKEKIHNLKYIVQACMWRRVSYPTIKATLQKMIPKELLEEWEQLKLQEIKQQTDEEIIKRFILERPFKLY
jgi:hypothetical protein